MNGLNGGSLSLEVAGWGYERGFNDLVDDVGGIRDAECSFYTQEISFDSALSDEILSV